MMKRVTVPVLFTGIVEVEVPGHLDDHDVHLLAQHYALGSMIATIERPARYEESYKAYMDKCHQLDDCSTDWDNSKVIDLNGSWEVGSVGDSSASG